MKRWLFTLFIVLLAGSLSAQYLAHRRKAFRSGGETPIFGPETFEGTGYALTGWGETGGGIDEDYTTTVLAGSQSGYVGTDGGQTTNTFSATPDVSVSFMLRFPSQTVGTGANDGLRMWDSSGTLICWVRLEGFTTTYGARVYHGAINQTSNLGFTTDTTYYIWVDYYQGTGSDGVARLFYNTTDTKPGSPSVSVTNGTATTQASAIGFITDGSPVYIIDEVTVSAL